MTEVTRIDDEPEVIRISSVQGAAGLSAYQIAVANGYVGTEAQWLEYLVGGAVLGYAWTQTVAATVWGPIAHGLGFRPSVTVIDTAGQEISPTIDHIDATQTLITHSQPYAGMAYFS